LTNTGEALRQHVRSQANSLASMEKEKERLLAQCRKFAALMRLLPSGMVDETMISDSPFTMVAYKAAMYEHESLDVRIAREIHAGMEEMKRKEELGDDDADAATEDTSAEGHGEEIKRLIASEAHLNSTNAFKQRIFR
jgi:hypothetical protein